MVTELYINSVKVDTTDDVVFALNYIMADIRMPDKRNANYSKTITIPGTQNNNQLFTAIYEIGADSSFNPNNKADVLLISAGAKTFEGYVQLKNILRQYGGAISYEINLFGTLGDIFQSMGEGYLSDLDFSELNHVKTAATITGSWANTSGYTYPLIDNGMVDRITQTNLTFDTQFMNPSVFVKTVWDKIFSTYGYTYNSSWISGSPFTKLIMPGLGIQKRTFTISGSVSFTITSTGDPSSTLQIRVVNEKVNGTTQVLYSDSYTDSDAFSHTFTIPLQSFQADPNDVISIQVLFTVGGFGTATCTATSGGYFGVTYSDYSNSGYASGDFFATKVSNQNITSGSPKVIQFTNEVTDPYNTFASSKHTVPQISILALVPKMKQRDFMLSLIRMFNLYFDVNTQDAKNLLVLPRDNYYSSGTTVDWSAKIDLSNEYQQQPMPLLDFKRYEWKYKQDVDFYNDLYTKTWNENYGDAYYDADTDFQTQTQTTEVAFSATPSVQSALNNMVLPCVVKDNPAVTITGNTYVGNARILYYAGLKSTSSAWKLKDGTGTTNFTTYPFASHVDDPLAPTLDLLFTKPQQVYWYISPESYTDSNLYNNYYSAFIDEVTDKDAKMLTASLYLTPYDIYSFSFQNAYYLLDNSFYVNHIIDFNPDSPNVTKVELIKIKRGTARAKAIARRRTTSTGIGQKALVFQSPTDHVYTVLRATTWKLSGGVNSVWALSGDTNPIAIFSPKDSVQ